MKTLLIDNKSKLIVNLKVSLPGEVTVKPWNSLSGTQTDAFDLIVLSGGSAFSVEGNEDKLKAELELIHQNKKPLIGICFGCELIVKAFGGTLERMAEPKKGNISIKINPQFRQLYDGLESFEVYENHHWRIKDLPTCFDVVASSEHGHELIKHRTLPIFGLQFHPEKVVAAGQGDYILKKTIEDATQQQ